MLNGIHWFTDNASGDFIGPDKGETVTMRVGVTF
jgi:phosphate-selective porin OprO/OprP